MPIYRMIEPGKFASFEKTPFQDLERRLEDWVEANPHLLFPDETVVFFGRQTVTDFGKQLDLLGVDESGASIVVELKRGMTPREVVAQTLEYAAWVDSLGLEELDAIAKAYALRHGNVVDGLSDIYRESFLGAGEDEEEGTGTEQKITFNARQRMCIVAEEFSPEVEQTLRYLRARLGVDISGIRFGIHQADNEILIDTEIVVGREPRTVAAGKSATPAAPESHEQLRERVTSEFVRQQVDALEDWIEGLGTPGLIVRHLNGSSHAVYVGDRRSLFYYFALKWVHLWMPDRMPGDLEILERLSQPASVRETGEGVTFNVLTEEDLNLVRPLMLRRLQLP